MPQGIIRDDVRLQIRAVCFDSFGTLVEIGDKRRPFKTLLGDDPTPDTVRRVLTKPTSLRDLAYDLSLALDEESMVALEADLEAELASTRLRHGMKVLWESLRQVGLRVGVCSNLAAPYQSALLRCLPHTPDALVMSFQVGFMKPQAEIYQQVCTQFRLEPEQVLFVGDHFEEDVIGPHCAGLFSMHIAEFERALAQGPSPATHSALVELLDRLAEFSQDTTRR
nr:HAD family hydrolase [Bradyrhizobium sp. CCH5-A9]